MKLNKKLLATTCVLTAISTASFAHDYAVSLTNVDDHILVIVNADVAFQCNFLQTCNKDITSLLHKGVNSISFEVGNTQQGYAYTITLKQDGVALFNETCERSM